MRWRARTVAFAAAIIAVLMQGALITRLELPLDIVPIVVIMAAMRMTRGEATVLGFVAGLVADIAPPANGLLGAQALVFCLVAYFAAANQSWLSQVWWLRAIVIGALSTIALGSVIALQLLSGQPLAFGWSVIAVLAWQVVIGSLLAALLWPAAAASMGPPPRRRMGVAP